MKVSLITTVFNEAGNIMQFLESYRNQTKYADEFIILDGGSTDRTAEIIRKFAQDNPYLHIDLLIDESCNKKQVNGPIARGRNRAIECSRNDVVAVTDAGCLLTPTWFEQITVPFQSSHVDIVAGWYSANITNDFQALYASTYMRTLAQIDPDTFLPSSRSIAFWHNDSTATIL